MRELTVIVDRLKRSHAQVLGQIGMLNPKAGLNSCRVSQGLSWKRDESVPKIVNFLGHRLQVSVQKRLHKPSRRDEQTSADEVNMASVEGMTKSIISVVAEYELAEFELIATNIFGCTVEGSLLRLQPQWLCSALYATAGQLSYTVINRARRRHVDHGYTWTLSPSRTAPVDTCNPAAVHKGLWGPLLGPLGATPVLF